MTQFEIARELARLASILSTKADTADALAAEHAKLRHVDDALKHLNLAKSGRHFVKVLEAAIEKLKPKRAVGTYEVPNWEQVVDYTKTAHPNWPLGDVQGWFNHFEACGWVIGKDKPVKNWKRAADNGFRNWQGKNPERARAIAVAQTANGDPEGWKEFLASLIPKRPYKSYKYELDFLRGQFHKSEFARRK